MIHVLIHLLLLALRSSENSPRRLPPPREVFGPRILSAVTVKQFELDIGHCYLLSNIVVEGTKYFHFILAVHDYSGPPLLWIAAESDLAVENSVLTLGIYTHQGYQDLGSSDSLRDINLFQDVAIEVARSHFGLV